MTWPTTPKNECTVQPTAEPVSFHDVKRNVYIVDDTADDEFIQNDLIPPARRFVENLAGRSLITQTRRQSYDYLPCAPISLRYSPVQSISSFTYTDSSGVTQTLSASYYDLDSRIIPARINVAYGQSWPTSLEKTNAVAITYSAGYGLSYTDVPSIYRRAIIVLCAHWYNNRDDLSCEDASGIIGRLESILAIEGRTVEYA